jgi:DNA (cytosine-5)-methyltransferase 1
MLSIWRGVSNAYYNENDPFAAAWLRELIARGLIAPGEVDTRSIVDVRSADLAGFSQCHFFAGIGTWSYALRCAGWPDDRPIWTGSCPCQPFSHAGQRTGLADKRHLWPAFFNLIRECRPDVIVGEQVAVKAGLGWLDAVQADLESENYAVGAIDLCAAGVGAPHIRQRLYWVANAGRDLLADAGSARLSAREPEAICGARGRQEGRTAEQCRGSSDGMAGSVGGIWRNANWFLCRDSRWRPAEPGTFPLAHGATARVGRLRGYGNAIVAPLAQVFIETVMELIHG